MTEAALRTYESLAEFAPDWVAIPGESINDLLEERGWTQADLATRTGFTTKHVNLLLKGKAPISEETALRSSNECWAAPRAFGSTSRPSTGSTSHGRSRSGRSPNISIG